MFFACELSEPQHIMATTMIAVIACVLLSFIHAADGMRFTITPTTFVPGVTSAVTMRCQVSSDGDDMSQLLLIQLEVMDRGNYVPVVTYTPGGGPRIMPAGIANHVKVNGHENQFTDISSSYLSVTYPFPAEQVAGNYTCVVSGLSATSLLVRYTHEGTLTLGAAVDELPRFMTAHVVELRSLIEKIKNEKNALMTEAARLRQVEQNVSMELAEVETAYANVSNEMAALKSRASQLISILNEPVSQLDRLSSVRPEQKVAFHAGMSQPGAKTAVLHQPLIFDHVITNEGQGYDPISGSFRAPVAGTYLFTVSVEAGSGHRDSEVSIMRGQHVLQTMHMSDDISYQHHTTSTIVTLSQGEEVTCQFTWLQGLPGYVGSTEANAPYVTAFTGYVLW